MRISKNAMDVAQSLFKQLDMHWTGDKLDQGMYRPAWSHQEGEAMDILSSFARDELSMRIYEDLAGNRYMVSTNHHNDNAPVRMVGSHVDAVKNGGRYDGPAGVVAPLAALYQAKMNGDVSNQPTVITIWRNEESPWLNQFAVGSKLATGSLSAEFLRTAKHTGFIQNTLLWQLNNIVRLRFFELCRKIESDDPKLIDVSMVEGLVETHIEQGSVLERADKSLGIVTVVRGNVRFPNKIDFYGEGGHTGTVPQENRRDAVSAMARFVVRVEDIFKQYHLSGKDIVWSFPQGGDINGKSSTISNRARVRPEVRSTDAILLRHVAANFQFVAQQIQQETGVRVVINKMNTQQPVSMNDVIAQELLGYANTNGIQTMRMPSGAGHDVQVWVEGGGQGGLIFIRHGNKGASHRPDEILGRTSKDNPFRVHSDFAKAVALNHAWMMGKPTPKKVMPIRFEDDIQRRGARRILAPQ